MGKNKMEVVGLITANVPQIRLVAISYNKLK